MSERQRKIPVVLFAVIVIAQVWDSVAAFSPELEPDTVNTVGRPAELSLTFEPYGVLWTAAAFESARTNGGDYTFFVLSPTIEGESAFHMDAKSSRLGVRMLGPDVCVLGCGAGRGLVEVDFQGSFVTENKPGLLLRHAYWEISGESFRVLGGQTWDVVSPLNPGMLMYTVGWGAGNIGYRRAQLRGEKSFAIDRTLSVLVQASANADIVSDFSAEPTIAGDHASWPVLEGRLAVNHPRASLGLSGHIGEQVFDFPPPNPGFDGSCRTWSANVDGVAKLSHYITMRGELFTGTNLGAFLGGALQGVSATRQDHIASTGGWAEIVANVSSALSAHAGFGVDDPDDENLTEPSERTRNQMLFGNVSYTVANAYVFGIEISHWQTDYVALESGKATHVALVTKFAF